MIEEFLTKLNNNEYISNHLYEYIVNSSKEVIPNDFNIDIYNKKVLDKLYGEQKEYFDHMYDGVDPNIHLDEEQCKAILADEKYSLIIAGAGTGKTTTMTAKVKYLVDKKNVQPERILVMSYTRKATEELAKRIEADFNIPVHVTTFHSLGFEYIREYYNNVKCDIIDRNRRNAIFLEYFKILFRNKNKIVEIINNFQFLKASYKFLFANFFINNFMKYNEYDDLLDDYVKSKIEEARITGINQKIDDWINRQLLKDEYITSIRGEYVKSAGEMYIANYLYKHGIDYAYEEIYEELMEHNSIYKPDFTIDFGGEKIYIEYFGMDDEDYNKIKEKKIKYHQSKNNKFISLDKVPLEQIEYRLNEDLRKLGVAFNDRRSEEIYEHILRLNPLSIVYPFVGFLYECEVFRKESVYRDNLDIVNNFLNSLEDSAEKNNLLIQYKYIQDFAAFYNNKCFGGSEYYFDFSDLLFYSVKYIEKLTSDTHLIFDYIIIDEYQDISKIKYELTKKTANRNDAKVSAVGDDWQTIYSFSGSRIEYIYKFKDYFKGAKEFNITKTYRNSQELINYSGEFIMKNADQLRKHLISDKRIDNPIVFEHFNSKFGPYEELDVLKQVILKIHKNNPDHKILILARTNRMIDKLLEDGILIDGIGTKIIYSGYENIDIEGMTMHKSKGLTFDEVIIIGLNRSFPSNKQGIHWYEALYRNKPVEEAIAFAEERRLFYVALTRTKNRVYLLCDDNPNGRSEFVTEIESIIKNNN